MAKIILTNAYDDYNAGIFKCDLVHIGEAGKRVHFATLHCNPEMSGIKWERNADTLHLARDEHEKPYLDIYSDFLTHFQLMNEFDLAQHAMATLQEALSNLPEDTSNFFWGECFQSQEEDWECIELTVIDNEPKGV